MLINSALPASPAPNENAAKIRRAATDFEALLLTQMLKSAREAGGTGDDDKAENSTMVELGEQQFAQALASSGGLGIAKMVVAGLTKHADR
jgi:Rod binding domain-containing protein